MKSDDSAWPRHPSQGSYDAGGIGIKHENIAPDHRIEGLSLLDRVQPHQAKGDVASAELFDPGSRGGDGCRRAIDANDEPIIADKFGKEECCIADPTSRTLMPFEIPASR
jgi:hypothetical protein